MRTFKLYNMDTNESINETKRPRERSSAYPSYTIFFCVELIKKIVLKFGSATFVTREEIAKKLSISEGSLSTQLGACVHYGLLEMKVKIGYKPTACFRLIVKHLTEAEKTSALQEALNTPDLYKRLLADPEIMDEAITVDGLAIRLTRSHNITDGASEKAAQVFLSNLSYLGISPGKHHQPTIEPDSDTDIGSDSESPGFTAIQKFDHQEYQSSKKEESPQVAVTTVPNSLTLEIPLKDQRLAKLIYPMDITDKDLDKILKFIDALRE